MKITSILWVGLMLSAGFAHADKSAGTPDEWESPIPKPGPFGMFLIDRLEIGFADEVDTYVWDAQGWYGGDRNRFWFKTEGEGEQWESPEDAELQVLYSRLFAPFWDWQVGARHDFRPEPNRTHLVVGIQGLAPYEFEIDSALFLSNKGDVTARFEAEYELKLTQRLILQPRFELNAAASDIDDIGVGSGINGSELGLRLRYEFKREFAPYVGISWEQLYGETATFARDESEPTSVTSFVVGVRMWF